MTFHHSELEVKKQSMPKYPDAAKEMGLGDQSCMVKVYIDEAGVPYQASVENCPKVFHAPTKAAIMKWRWYPPRVKRQKVKAQTLIVFRYKLKD